MDGLLQEYVEQLKVATDVYEKVCSLATDFTYCLRSLGHLVKWSLRENFSSNWKADAIDHAEQSREQFATIHRETGELERRFGAYWD